MKLSTTELRSFFYGTLLGDSYIHDGAFGCRQVSKELIMFKKKIIEDHLPDAKIKIYEQDAYIDKHGGAHQKHYTLHVSKCAYIKKLYPIFYKNGKKIYTPGVINKLTPLGFAMWYADDGTTILVTLNKTTGSARARRIQFCTDNFSLECHMQMLKDFEKTKLSAFLVDRHWKSQFRIGLDLFTAQDFFIDIGRYFIKYFPTFLYKLDLGYRGESLFNRRYVTESYHNFYNIIKTNPFYIDRLVGRAYDIVQTTTSKDGLGNQE